MKFQNCMTLTRGFFFGCAVWSFATELLIADILIPLIEEGTFQLDGGADEPMWISAYPLSLDFEISPRYAEKTTWLTEGKVFHDGTSIFFFFSAKDPSPERIIALESERDAIVSDDRINVLLETSGNARRAYSLGVNAKGTQFDRILSSFGEGSPNWSGEWQAHAKLTGNGYQMEIVVPFSTIGISPDEKGDVSFGLNVERLIPRDRTEVLSLAPIDRREQCQECQYTTARATGVNTTVGSWRITPYILASGNRVTNDDYSTTDRNADAGVDILWNLNSTDKVLATINPDFSQIEIDTIQFEINRRFPINFPERRPFFTEDSGLYRTSLSLINTRNIFDPDFGAQFTRRAKRYSAGVFLTDDNLTTFILPGLESSRRITLATPSTNLVGRMQFNFSKAVTVGTMLTAKYSAEGYNNVVLGMDGNYNSSTKSKFGWEVVGSKAQNPNTLQEDFNLAENQSGYAALASYTYSGKIYRAFSSYSEIGRDFRADLGNINQVGVRNFIHSSTVTFVNPSPESKIATWSVSGIYARQDEIGGENLIARQTVTVWGQSRKNTFLLVGVSKENESFEGVQFTLDSINMVFSFVPKDRLNLSLGLSRREFIDLANLQEGVGETYSASLQYSIVPSFAGWLSYSTSRFDTNSQRLFSVDSVNINMKYHFNLKHHLNFILSYGDLAQPNVLDMNSERNSNLAYQLVYRYQPSTFTTATFGISGTSEGTEGFQALDTVRLFAFAKLSYSF